ncbi:conjugal transfer protein VirC2 [Bradyrhizobium sp. CCGUVB23]|uniref:conjugal transfer protein VirC2 n=1 Tax=Bradyrhizobium sp. CCGUVB23 TaxID=2949630 RepID=UPI0020B3E2BD|nr:conjugal transfer protein VirC2 [Bradyrhizobium sp. CCGUVB23]MCP3468657.1 conjugal transfer protein VirC2 [Bradyrhizobium sp. CCGUVB23]
MGIRKPVLSVGEAKRLATARGRIDVLEVPATSGDSTSPELPTSADQTESPPRPFPGRRQRRADQQPMSTADALSSTIAPETIQVFLSALPPARKVSPVFDNLCGQYSPVKSLQMILRRALDDYEAMLENGSFRSAPKSYPVPDQACGACVVVQTSRMLPTSLVQIARAHFDPFGLETARAFGHKLATAALACFFAAETNSRR